MTGTRRGTMVKVLTTLVAVALVFAIWDLAIRVLHVKPFVVPPPSTVFRKIATSWRGTLQALTWQTLLETVYGFLTGAVVGFVLAVAMGQLRIVQRLVYPVLIASQAVPVVAVAAPLVIILGFGMTPKIVIVAWIVFFPVVVNVLDGLANVDRDLLNLARVMNGSRLRVFALIELPATLTPLFSALKLGATYAVTGAVIGEWTASANQGLGTYLISANASMDTAGVYGATLILTAIGITSFLLIVLLENLATPWRTRSVARRRSRRAGAERKAAVPNEGGIS